jgi:serine/threonine protein kinase/WD40 repeat protein
MVLAVGEKIGPYAILGKVGAGGMGEVYRARDERLGRDVALKVLPVTGAPDAAQLRRFEQEARAAGALNHPNILAVYDFDASVERPYLVAELLDGMTLRETLNGPLPQRKALDFATQVARGLAAAHDKGIVHRDLKPENLFVTRDGRVKILDFGLAKLIANGEAAETSDVTQAATASGTVLGTAGYMAPEQVQGRPADHRSDLFAFGAILYEMLAGKRAFDGASPVEKAYAILKDEPAPLSSLGREVVPALERVMLRCLEKNPDDRFQSARDLAFALEALSGDRSAIVSNPAPRVRARRSSSLWWMVGLSLAIGTGAFLAGRRASKDASSGAPPRYQRVTFRRGQVHSARFAPDGKTIVYAQVSDSARGRVFTSTPGNPEARPITSPGTMLFAVSSMGEMALSIDPEIPKSGSMLARATLAGGAPKEILDGVISADWSPDGKDLAVVRLDRGRYRLEYPIGKTLAETSDWLYTPRVSPRGTEVAYFDYPIPGDDRGTLELMSSDGKHRTLTGPWATLEGLAWSPDGTEVWFAGGDSGALRSLYAVNLEGKVRRLATGPGTITLHDVSKDGHVLLTRDDARVEIRAVRPGSDGGEAETELSWFDTSIPTSLSADGKRLAFIEGGDVGDRDAVAYFRDLDGAPAVHLGEGIAWSISPDGKWVLLSPKGPYTELLLVPTGPGMTRKLPAGDIHIYDGAEWFPDGKRIAIAGREAGHLSRTWIQDLDGESKPRAVTEEGTIPWAPPSPDGTRLVVRDVEHRASILPLDGGPAIPLAKLPPGDVPIQWSSDGKSFFVVRRGGGPPLHLFTFDISTGRETPWRDAAPHDVTGEVAMSRFMTTTDGKVFVYSQRQCMSDLYIVDGFL